MKTRGSGAGLTEYRRRRNFRRTGEPRGRDLARRRRGLRFVIQKHAASTLHYDFRLELDGVMKSWAVPKGASRDPAQKRLAVQTEDHPIEYNTFEGTIPEGEYGAGAVIVWDRGTYRPGDDDGAAFGAKLDEGHAAFTLDGERLRGRWALIRLKRGKDQWLLIKERDRFAVKGDHLAADDLPSVRSGRTLDEIAGRAVRGGPTRPHGSARGGRSKADRTAKRSSHLARRGRTRVHATRPRS
jgi:bifunctional non-homologous end joining protein LigD